ncbi:MAG: hypothetical protein C6W57_12505 [Caldibacillus debilis]|nr:MAG: hypothetical protein C6W57_12505 [Caldibacillus debilis]
MDTPALMVGFSFFGRGSFAGSAVNDYSSQPLPQNGRLGRTRGRPALFRQNLAATNGTFLSREQGVFFGENRGKQVGPVFPRGSCFFSERKIRGVRRKPVHMAAFPREKKTTSLAGPGRVAAFPRRETAAQFFRTSDRGRPKGKEKRRSTKRIRLPLPWFPIGQPNFRQNVFRTCGLMEKTLFQFWDTDYP